MSLAEFALIDRIRARTLERDDILLGIGDDAALLQPRANEQLVVTADTLNSGVHFPVRPGLRHRLEDPGGQPVGPRRDGRAPGVVHAGAVTAGSV
jgi:hypothetical protein